MLAAVRSFESLRMAFMMRSGGKSFATSLRAGFGLLAMTIFSDRSFYGARAKRKLTYVIRHRLQREHRVDPAYYHAIWHLGRKRSVVEDRFDSGDY